MTVDFSQKMIVETRRERYNVFPVLVKKTYQVRIPHQMKISFRNEVEIETSDEGKLKDVVGRRPSLQGTKQKSCLNRKKKL